MIKSINYIVALWVVMFCIVNAPAIAVAFDGERSQEAPGSRHKSLTDQQKARVKSILSKYHPSSLTADDATAIFAAFRKARIPGGPDLIDAIRAAGFDPEKLRSLAPPPGRPPRPNDRMSPDRPPGDGVPPPDRQ